MATQIKMVQNDTAPNPQFNLVQSDNVTPFDLTGCTIKFRIMDQDTLSETNSAHQTCTLVGAATLGQVTYQWVIGDIPLAKTYFGDVEVTLATGKVETPFKQVPIIVRAKN